MSKYTELITNEHSDKPKFTSFVDLITQWALDMQSVATSNYDVEGDIEMLVDNSGGLGSLGAAPAAFDLDLAVGAQLDAVGARVGLSRTQNVPGYGFISLGDTDYSAMIRAKIQANHWNGSMDTLQALLQSLFPNDGFLLVAYDNQDMTMDIYVIGSAPSALQLALLTGGLIVPRPEGVLINGYTQLNDPLFGLDYNNDFIAGLDVGAFSSTL